ncbi:MAG: DUF2797 domain-containing protein [Methylococcales bacterium]|nr:DUF2797 domain-containing protein [Methylococcales bacterium]MBT7443713.1 DUF2797 domain-containing protein [Methylococcales bacterium]
MTGNIRKLHSTLENPVQYKLPIGDQFIPLNPLLGKTCKLQFTGKIQCIHCARDIKKSYSQGYCFPCAQKLAECDICIVRPEKCHYEAGTCRDETWAQDNCFSPHIIYLSNTSGLKVGITRQTQIPTRWIDQGARAAIPLIQVGHRHHAGLIEVIIGRSVNDKTNWRNMLKNVTTDIDLVEQKQILIDQYAEEIEHTTSWRELSGTVTTIHYPVLEYPVKVTSLNLDKQPTLEGSLQGIKGQYLIFDIGVINLRKYAGYEITFSYDS